jgi:hypothetical protein
VAYLLFVGLGGERGDLVLRLVARLIGDVADLDHVHHLHLLVVQVLAQLLVDLCSIASRRHILIIVTSKQVQLY